MWGGECKDRETENVGKGQRVKRMERGGGGRGHRKGLEGEEGWGSVGEGMEEVGEGEEGM